MKRKLAAGTDGGGGRRIGEVYDGFLDCLSIKTKAKTKKNEDERGGEKVATKPHLNPPLDRGGRCNIPCPVKGKGRDRV